MKYNLFFANMLIFKKVGHPIVKFVGNTANMNKRKTELRCDDADVTVSDGYIYSIAHLTSDCSAM